jgi:hypothetical protein
MRPALSLAAGCGMLNVWTLRLLRPGYRGADVDALLHQLGV